MRSLKEIEDRHGIKITSANAFWLFMASLFIGIGANSILVGLGVFFICNILTDIEE